MNINQYKELKNSEIEAFRYIDTQLVSKETLFKKSEFDNLDHDNCLKKAIELGWRWDNNTGKYYRIIGY